MFIPRVLARMIQGDNGLAFYVSPLDLRPLVTVASPTSQTKIILFCPSACG